MPVLCLAVGSGVIMVDETEPCKTLLPLDLCSGGSQVNKKEARTLTPGGVL